MTDHVRHPAPVNQFSRLDRDSPTAPWVKTTPWNHTHTNAAGQLIDWDGYLCMASEGAVMADAATGGRLHYSPGQVHDHQHDNMGGIGIDDVKVALDSLAGIQVLTPGDFNWPETIAAVRARRHVGIGVDYRKVPEQFQLQQPGNFDHALGIDDYRDSDGWILVYDSLGTHPRWQPQNSVRAAAEGLAARVRGTSGSLFVGLTGIRPPLNAAAPHYKATVIKRTALYAKDGHTAYVQPVGTVVEVRGAIYVIAGKACYPVVKRPGYFLPRANVRQPLVRI